MRNFDDGDLSYVNTLKKLETLTRKPREHIHSFYTTLNLEFSKTEFITDPILYESQRDRYNRDKLMQYLGPKTKTEVLEAYYRKLSTNGYSSANFVLEEIKANKRVYDDWIKLLKPPAE